MFVQWMLWNTQQLYTGLQTSESTYFTTKIWATYFYLIFIKVTLKGHVFSFLDVLILPWPIDSKSLTRLRMSLIFVASTYSGNQTRASLKRWDTNSHPKNLLRIQKQVSIEGRLDLGTDKKSPSSGIWTNYKQKYRHKTILAEFWRLLAGAFVKKIHYVIHITLDICKFPKLS